MIARYIQILGTTVVLSTALLFVTLIGLAVQDTLLWIWRG